MRRPHATIASVGAVLVICWTFQRMSARAENRTWTDQSGAVTKEGSLEKLEGNWVHLKLKDGQGIRVPLKWLSNGDQEYIRESAGQTPTPAGGGTHKQAALISVVSDTNDTARLLTFSLDAQERVLAGVGGKSGEIRVFDKMGNRLAQWPLPVLPEAVNTSADGSVLIAGQGRLLKLDGTGKILLDRPAPQVTGVVNAVAAAQPQAGGQNAAASKASRAQASKLKTFRQRLEGLQKRERQVQARPASSTDEQKEKKQELELVARLQRSVKNNIEAIERPMQQSQAAASAQTQQAEVTASQLKVVSVSATSKDVFVACASTVGRGFDIWRTSHEFDKGQKIVEGLSGCCNQMDVQASDEGVFVAENTRHKVRRFDRNGRGVNEWGSHDRAGGLGFGGCCNPMNVAIGPAQSVYTAESGSGRILRFHPNGTFIELVGQVELVPGCKKVAIAVSPSGERVYMLDITRNHIVVMAGPSRTP